MENENDIDAMDKLDADYVFSDMIDMNVADQDQDTSQ